MTEKEKTDEKKTLNGVPVTQAQLEEARKELPGNQRIIEVAPGTYRKLERMRE